MTTLEALVREIKETSREKLKSMANFLNKLTDFK